jgi:hypothetical protein
VIDIMSGVGVKLAEFVNSKVMPNGELAEDVYLTVGGAIKYGCGYIHPEHFRDMFGEEAYQEVLARPRIVCEYDYEEETDELEPS